MIFLHLQCLYASVCRVLSMYMYLHETKYFKHVNIQFLPLPQGNIISETGKYATKLNNI